MCKSDGGTRQHNYTTKSKTIPYIPNGKSRDRVRAGGESRMPEGRGNSSPGGFLNTLQCPLLKQGKYPPMTTHTRVRRGYLGSVATAIDGII